MGVRWPLTGGRVTARTVSPRSQRQLISPRDWAAAVRCGHSRGAAGEAAGDPVTRAQELAIWMVGLALAVVVAVHGSDAEEWVLEVVAPLVIVGGLVVFSLRRGGLGHDPRVARTARLALRVVHGLLAVLGVAAAAIWIIYEAHDRRVAVEDFACWDRLSAAEQQTFRDLSLRRDDALFSSPEYATYEGLLRVQEAAKCHVKIWRYAGERSDRAWVHGERVRSFGGEDLTFAAIAAAPLALWGLRRLLANLGSPPAPPTTPAAAGGMPPGPPPPPT
jgi:hypothetical protein